MKYAPRSRGANSLIQFGQIFKWTIHFALVNWSKNQPKCLIQLIQVVSWHPYQYVYRGTNKLAIVTLCILEWELLQNHKRRWQVINAKGKMVIFKFWIKIYFKRLYFDYVNQRWKWYVIPSSMKKVMPFLKLDFWKEKRMLKMPIVDRPV